MPHEFDGKKYEQASTHQQEWGSSLIAELDLRGNERVLDLGCGDGALSAGIAELVPDGSVLAIDASRGMLDTALQRTLENLEFRLMDINEIDFNGEFDIVFSNATLHWVQDHERLLLNVHRSLRPAGRFLFDFAGDGNSFHFLKSVREAIRLSEFSDYFATFQWPWHMPHLEEYAALLESSRFREIMVREENRDRYFRNVDAMVKWIDQPSIVPFLARLPESHRESFREYVIARMIEETRVDDGRCFEIFRRIHVSGWK